MDGRYWTWYNGGKHGWRHWPYMRAAVITTCRRPKAKISGWCVPVPLNPPEGIRSYSSVRYLARRRYSRRRYYFRYSTLDNPSIWYPHYKKAWQYAKMDLGVNSYVSGIILQGDRRGPYFTTWFKVATSVDGKRWKWSKYYRGNFDRNTKVVNLFRGVSVARYVRIYETHYHRWPALRWGIMGCAATKSKIAAVDAIARNERKRQYREGKRWRVDRWATAVDRRNGYEAKAADRRLKSADHVLRRNSARLTRGEIGRQFAEQVRRKQEGKRIHQSKVEAHIDRKKSATEARHEILRQRADRSRSWHERVRHKRELSRIRHSKDAARGEVYRRKRAWELEKKERAGEYSRWRSEGKRRKLLGPRVEAFKASDASLHREMTELSLGEHGRKKEDAMWDRAEADRNKEIEDVKKSLSANHGVVVKHEAARSLNEEKRRGSEAASNHKTQVWTHLVNAVARGSLKKEMDLMKSELARKSSAKESQARLERVDSAVARSEHWRERNEAGRRHAEQSRASRSKDDGTAVLDETKQAKAVEVRLNTTEERLVSQWKDILVVLARSLGSAQKAQDGAAKAEGTREAEESKRAKETEDAIRKLIGAENDVNREKAQLSKAENSRESSEKQRDAEMETILAQLMAGEKGLENMEVLMQKVELIRKEKEAGRLEQEKLHDDYLKRLTGNLTHDAEVHKQYEAERARAQESRMRRMKDLVKQITSETKAEERAEDKREQDEVARVAQQNALDKEDKEEQGEIVSELSTLEQLELAAQRADKQAEENERQREAAEGRRVRELLTAAFKKRGLPGPQGEKGLPATETTTPNIDQPTARPAVPSTANPDCTQTPDAPYCGRRRRSAVPGTTVAAG